VIDMKLFSLGRTQQTTICYFSL